MVPGLRVDSKGVPDLGMASVGPKPHVSLWGPYHYRGVLVLIKGGGVLNRPRFFFIKKLSPRVYP